MRSFVACFFASSSAMNRSCFAFAALARARFFFAASRLALPLSTWSSVNMEQVGAGGRAEQERSEKVWGCCGARGEGLLAS